MSKVILAINTMVLNTSFINDVTAYKFKYFFMYGRYVWSITDPTGHGDEFELVYYPGYEKVGLIEEIDRRGVVDNYVTYTNADYKTREATESFKELYQSVKEKLYQVDNVLDDIIGIKNRKSQ